MRTTRGKGKYSKEYAKYEETYCKYYAANKDQYYSHARKAYLKLKVEVLSYYSSGDTLVCVICGEDRLECLSIDHINGGGNKHRKEIGSNGGGSTYHWLRKNNFPSGFRTLCMNCQAVERNKLRRKQIKEHG